MASSGDHRARSQRRDQVLELAPDIILEHGLGHGLFRHAAQSLGLTDQALRHIVGGEPEILRQLALRHLNDAFEAVCFPDDWEGPPMDVLRAMCTALLDYAASKPSRHRVFLLHRHTLAPAARAAIAEKLTYLANNFHLAMAAAAPHRNVDRLAASSRLLLATLLHAPLWWEPEAAVSREAWLCAQLGVFLRTKIPPWRHPQAARRKPA